MLAADEPQAFISMAGKARRPRRWGGRVDGELRAGGRKNRFTAREIPAAERAPLVAAYVQRYGSKYGGFVAKEFAALPDPADHPVFLLER